jgi:hypothetical protein
VDYFKKCIDEIIIIQKIVPAETRPNPRNYLYLSSSSRLPERRDSKISRQAA